MIWISVGLAVVAEPIENFTTLAYNQVLVSGNVIPQLSTSQAQTSEAIPFSSTSSPPIQTSLQLPPSSQSISTSSVPDKSTVEVSDDGNNNVNGESTKGSDQLPISTGRSRVNIFDSFFTKKGAIVGIAFGIVVFLLIVIAVLVVLLFVKRRGKKDSIKKVEEQLEIQMEPTENDTTSTPTEERKSRHNYDVLYDEHMITWTSLEIQSELGEGSFGKVYLALWKGKKVAVKKAIEELPEDQRGEFVREAKLMR